MGEVGVKAILPRGGGPPAGVEGASRDPGAMMPELGRNLVHAEGVDLVRAWITAWLAQCNANAPATVGTAASATE